jgi:hypothetical protein
MRWLVNVQTRSKLPNITIKPASGEREIDALLTVPVGGVNNLYWQMFASGHNNDVRVFFRSGKCKGFVR